MTEGEGFGKVILFGEHFVVYKLPGIASSVSDTTKAKIESGEEGLLIDDLRFTVSGYKEKKKEEIRRQFRALLDHFSVNLKETPLKITLSGNLLCDSGIGASAALATSVSRAFNKMLNLNLDDDKINEAAYKAEEAGSGTPSGIDNTCSVFGGFITFEKSETGPNKIEKLSINQPVEIVMASTGIAQETREVVGDVRELKESREIWFSEIINRYKEIYSKAVEAIKSGDWEVVGDLMDQNQKLLQDITVSSDELETIIKIARDNGALGAKLTGTGRGGYVVALTPGEIQDKVSKAIEEAGYMVLKTTIG